MSSRTQREGDHPTRPIFTMEPRSASHAEELFPVLSDPHIYEFLDEDPPASVTALRERLARSESRRSPDGSEHWLNWLVRDEVGAVAGQVQTTIFPDSTANVAYLFARSHWGRGVAFSAVERMLQTVREAFVVTTFYVVLEHENHRSKRLAQRLGFKAASLEDAANKKLSATEIMMSRS